MAVSRKADATAAHEDGQRMLRVLRMGD